MADKGFTITDLLPLGISLNLSPFLGGSSQMPAEDVVKNARNRQLEDSHQACYKQDKKISISGTK